MPPLDQLPAAYLASEAKRVALAAEKVTLELKTTALEQENALLRAQIELLKRKLFGTSQSDGARSAEMA